MNLRLTIVCEQFLIMKNEAKMKETAVNIIPCMYHKKDMSLQSNFELASPIGIQRNLLRCYFRKFIF